MGYEYSFSQRTLGSSWFRRDTYRFFHEGLKKLRALLQVWNEREAEPPYQREVADLKRMIQWGEQRLAAPGSDDDEISLDQVSVGHARYLKAAAMLQVLNAEDELEREMSRLPDGVISARRQRIRKMKAFAELSLLKPVDPADVLWEVAPSPSKRTAPALDEGKTFEWDLFVCHATEDKVGFVADLVNGLTGRGLKVWYDEFELRLGDHLRRSIEKGLLRSRYGVVVLSPRFFAKEWPQRELDGMAALEVDGRKVILPIWHELAVSEVRARSPMLADRIAIRSDRGIDDVVNAIVAAMRTDE